MDGGWFGEHADFGPVFIKKFRQDQMEEATAEVALFEGLDAQHPNVSKFLLHEVCNGSLVIMQHKLAGGDLLKHILKTYKHDFDNTGLGYSEEEVRKMFKWLAEGTQFLHRWAPLAV